MAATTTAVFSLFFVLLPSLSAASSSPYHSAATLFQNYHSMLATFKIFIYTPSKPFDFPNAATASLFYTSLRRSPFLTHDPTEAHLFFVPFSPDTSTRSLSRVVRELRNDLPYWNRSLGADHFFLSPAGIDFSSDRNVLELKKNSVQISVFPVVSGYFIPHIDVTLPPLSTSTLTLLHAPVEKLTATSFLGYLRWDGETESELVNELKSDADFFIEEKSEPPPLNHMRGFTESKFCLFLYHGDVTSMVEAMAWGCVPVVIVDRPIQDLPLMDILRWSDLALLVAAPPHGGAAAARLKQVLNGVSEEKYGEMKKLGVAASKHLVWNDEAQPFDAFHMVMYQLWLRRHVIRYSRSEIV